MVVKVLLGLAGGIILFTSIVMTIGILDIKNSLDQMLKYK